MASLPSLDHFTYRDYEHFYEPAEDTYLLVDALMSEMAALTAACRAPVCVELGCEAFPSPVSASRCHRCLCVLYAAQARAQ